MRLVQDPHGPQVGRQPIKPRQVRLVLFAHHGHISRFPLLWGHQTHPDASIKGARPTLDLRALQIVPKEQNPSGVLDKNRLWVLLDGPRGTVDDLDQAQGLPDASLDVGGAIRSDVHD